MTPDSPAFDEQALTELIAARIRSELDRLCEPGSPNGLTATERRVAAAVLAGARNSDIAADQFMGIRTVEAHLSAIYRKAAVHSRLQLVAQLLTATPVRR